ncbi:MAG: hypothetical protein AAFX45_06060 [Pseudomonadota bacterium]
MMLFFNRKLGAISYLIAGFVAIVVPMGLGYSIYRLDPGACYDGPCLMPLLLVITPPYAAPVLTGLFALNRRRKRSLPDGWLPTILASGVVGQAGMSAFSFVMAPAHIREIFFSDVLLVPQGLYVGFAVGAVFWVVLYTCGRGGANE